MNPYTPQERHLKHVKLTRVALPISALTYVIMSAAIVQKKLFDQAARVRIWVDPGVS